MSRILTEYEDRLQKREIHTSMDIERHQCFDPVHLKFYPTGEIKAYFGMTCISWIDHQSQLFENLCAAQQNIHAGFEQIEVDQFFYIF